MAYIKAHHGPAIARPPVKRPATRRDPGFQASPHMAEILGKALAKAKNRRPIDPGFHRGGFAGFPAPQKPQPHRYPVGSEPWIANQPIYHGPPHIMDGGGQMGKALGIDPYGQVTPGGTPSEYSFAGDQPGMPPLGPIGFPGMGDMKNNPPWQTQQPGFYDEPPDGPLPSMPPQHPVQGLSGFPQAPQYPYPGIIELLKQMMQSRQPRPRWEGTLNPGVLPPQTGNRMFTPM